MTIPHDEVTLSSVSERLDVLVDLFKRRLLEDRAKQSVIEDLQARLTRAEEAVSALAVKPVVDGLSLVIERLQAADPAMDLRASISDELEYILESLGVATITAEAGEPIDRLRHEIASASGDGTELCVGELFRAGYEKGGVVLRPAKVSAIRIPMEDAAIDGGLGEMNEHNRSH